MSVELENGSLTHDLRRVDPTMADIIDAERTRQSDTLELIASENHASRAVIAAVGSCLINKYAEGLPGKRWYSGCANFDDLEQLAIDRAIQLFGCAHANVQPHSGANANLAVCFALLGPGDTFLSVVLSDGGHLTHGSPANISGTWFNPIHYPLVYDESRDDCGHIDYDAVAELAAEHKPKLIMCGYSAYPRTIDFARFRGIADSCGAYLMADIAHIAGLVAGGSHPSPFPHCHVVTTTTHKTLRGPRGGLILTNDDDLATRINKAVFPGIQGGPLMHEIGGKAVCFGEALKPEFKDYAHRIVANAKALAATLIERGYALVSGGTDNHLMLIDFRSTHPDLTGHEVAVWMEQAGLITNKNTVPRETRSPFKGSGIRLGSPSLTTRGMGPEEMAQVGDMIDRVIGANGDPQVIAQVRGEVSVLCGRFPLHE